MDRRGSAKKRKLTHDAAPSLDTTKPTAFFVPTPKGRPWTLSIAIPSSILADCSTADQRIVSPGRIARACAVFCVDELIIYDDSPTDDATRRQRRQEHERDPKQYTGDIDPCHYLAHVFSFIETPPFMRKALFPLHPNLRLAGLLPSLDMPHHPHMRDALPYREGFTTDEKPDSRKGTLVDVGLPELVHIPDAIPPKTRVTLHFPPHSPQTAEAVHPKQPRTEGGYYWGYDVRRCNSLSSVFTESPFEEGYDVSIGTSERGLPASKAFPYSANTLGFNHLLIVFGGPRGLEYAAMNDPDLGGKGISGGKTKELFDHWVNVLPNQGSRTIRTDEAVYIALTTLRRLWDSS